LGSPVTISGSISPPHAAAVTIEVSRDGGLTWSVLATVASAADGSYSYVWTPPEPVTYMLRASWPGDADHYGATSGIVVLRVTLRAFPPARIVVERLEKGRPTFIDLRAVEPRLSVLYLNLTARVDVERATITVEELVARPPDAPPPPHVLYRCINITTDLDPAAIASVAIGFRVNQSWIREYRVNKTAVRLLRLHLGSWEALTTFLVGEDAGYAYYQAASPGLSIFAVVGEALPPPRPAEFRLSGLSISPGEVRPGERVNVTVAVANVGGLAGEYVVTLRVNGTVEATRAVSLAGGASTTVSFALVKAVPGAYVVEVDGLRGSFRVRAPRPAEFRLSNLSISPAEVEAGEPVSVSVEVRNVGGSRARAGWP
jgi:PGF-pre-PGF domain-containing protein